VSSFAIHEPDPSGELSIDRRTPQRVLAAEDNPVFLSMLRTMLTRWGYDVVTVSNGSDAWQVLQSPDAPRLAILDWMMPGLDGVDVCRKVRMAGREPYIYILLLTGRTESGDLVQGMEAGADDYLTKPLNTQELRVRLRAGSRIVDLQEQLLAAREALREQATHDSLTGLWNRAAILDSVNTELARAAREGHPFSLLMADLDRFKLINDTYGHQGGDNVLREATRRMKSVIRVYDAIGRYGGEEFMMVLPGCEPSTACAQAERIRESVAASPIDTGSEAIAVTCSIGVSYRRRPSQSDSASLVREADLALYKAKAAGRNRVELADPDVGALPNLAVALSRD